MRIWLTVLLAGALVAPGAAFVAVPGVAFAEPTAAGEESQPYVILAGESTIEKLSDKLGEAEKRFDEANAKVLEMQGRIDEIEAALPAQQERSNAGMKQRYILQSNPLAVVDSLLSSESLGTFLRHVDYLEIVSRSNLRELNKLKAMEQELAAARDAQVAAIADAQAQLDEAQAELSKEQDKRAQTQREDVEDAAKQAREQGGEKSVGVAYDGGKQPEDYKEAATEDTEELSDGADWHAGREAFIAEWAGRIDAYLEGSALAGQGENFAAAAWKHGVDPRWSPAISNTESSKGAVCIRPFNAWGWGAADSDPYGLALEWQSWAEAIDAHVAGLAEGYGYTISLSNAKRYCPNTWQSWYNKTLAQMSQI